MKKKKDKTILFSFFVQESKCRKKFQKRQNGKSQRALYNYEEKIKLFYFPSSITNLSHNIIIKKGIKCKKREKGKYFPRCQKCTGDRWTNGKLCPMDQRVKSVQWTNGSKVSNGPN